MDAGLSAAVVKVFVDLYNDGLIYRGTRLVNWDPKAQSTLSDAEVENEEVDTFLWHLRYRAEDGGDGMVIATTRPETYLADVAVAVHPDDERYAHLIGKQRRAAAGRARDPGDRRRRGRAGVRHRRGQGDARARPDRLRDRPAPRLADADRDRLRRPHLRAGLALRRTSRRPSGPRARSTRRRERMAPYIGLDRFEARKRDRRRPARGRRAGASEEPYRTTLPRVVAHRTR